MPAREGGGARRAAWASWARTTTWTRCSAGCPARAPRGPAPPPACVPGGPCLLLIRALTCAAHPSAHPCRGLDTLAAWAAWPRASRGSTPLLACVLGGPYSLLIQARIRAAAWTRLHSGLPGRAPPGPAAARARALSRRHRRAHGPLARRGLARAWRARAAGSLGLLRAVLPAHAGEPPACACHALTLGGATREPTCGAAQMRPGPTAAAST